MMLFLKAILKYLQTAKRTGSYKSNDNSSNNGYSCNSPQKLFLIHLPNEILSMIILELLNEWCLVKSTCNRYMRGLLDILQIPPELATNRMIPLSQVNRFFHHLVWAVMLKHSYWNQIPYKEHGSVRGMNFFKMKPFVFTKNTLQSRGIEPVNQFYIKGSIGQDYLDFVHKLCLERMPFLVSSTGTGIRRTFKAPKLRYLTTLWLSTQFLMNSALKYEKLESRHTNRWMKSHEMVKGLNVELPPFVEVMMKNKTTNKTAVREKIITYHEVLICHTLAKMISLLDHPVDCTIRHICPTSREVDIVLWCFEKANIFSYIRTLEVLFHPDAVISSEFAKLLAALELEQICLVCVKNKALNKKLASLLIENNTRLRAVYYKTPHVANLRFPDEVRFLSTQSHIFFHRLNAPLSQRFARLVELALDFQVQIHRNFIKKSILQFPTLQTFTVSGKVNINIRLVRCILESNPTVNALSIYYHGFYEDLEPLYQSFSHVKLLNMTYENRFEGHSTLKFNLESLLDVVLRNTRSLEIIMIHQSSKTKPLSFSKFAIKLACEHKKNTKNLRYLYIYNSTKYRNSLITHNLVSIFFNDRKIDKSKLSPYNPAVKKLYRIDGVIRGKKVDPRRCRLELDVRGVQKLMNSMSDNVEEE